MDILAICKKAEISSPTSGLKTTLNSIIIITLPAINVSKLIYILRPRVAEDMRSAIK